MTSGENTTRFEELSHRAARRVIQRAVVLAGRDHLLRTHIRLARAETLWTIEDWRFCWTVLIDRGRLDFTRKPAKRPDVTFAWAALADFALLLETPAPIAADRSDFFHADDPKARKAAVALYAAFIPRLRQVLVDPFDEDGTPLIAQNR